jgi:hypothetical protein
MRLLFAILTCVTFSGCASAGLHTQYNRVTLFCGGVPVYETDYIEGPMVMVAPSNCEQPKIEVR